MRESHSAFGVIPVVLCRAAIMFTLAIASPLHAQERMPEADRLPVWLTMQAVPGMAWTSLPNANRFAFEWEVTPVLYTWGMNRHVSRWHSFIITPPERFTGSVEVTGSLLLYPTQLRSSHWGGSVQCLAHLPLIEHGEYLVLNAGAAEYWIGGTPATFLIGGFGTFYGFLHYNFRYAPAERAWMHAIEIRLF